MGSPAKHPTHGSRKGSEVLNHTNGPPLSHPPRSLDDLDDDLLAEAVSLLAIIAARTDGLITCVQSLNNLSCKTQTAIAEGRQLGLILMSRQDERVTLRTRRQEALWRARQAGGAL
jgi:hypothetical protein